MTQLHAIITKTNPSSLFQNVIGCCQFSKKSSRTDLMASEKIRPCQNWSCSTWLITTQSLVNAKRWRWKRWQPSTSLVRETFAAPWNLLMRSCTTLRGTYSSSKSLSQGFSVASLVSGILIFCKFVGYFGLEFSKKSSSFFIDFSKISWLLTAIFNLHVI